MGFETAISIAILVIGVSFIIYRTQFSVPHKVYIDESIAYLRQKRPVERRDYVPTESVYEQFRSDCSDRINLSEMAKDILRHMGLPNASVPVYPVSELNGNAAGMFVQSGNGDYIEVKVHDYTRPNEVLAVLIHECMHYYLRTTGLGFDNRMKNEILTDTSTIYFGFFDYINSGYIHVGYIGYSEIKYIERILRSA